jgi:catechol 2,3-dioxygenase-like lactoylglutathione lyase family enzyme
MIAGAHFVFYSNDPEADRVFFRDILGFHYVDDGGGWLIFALPPSEVAVHPMSGNSPLVYGGGEMLGAILFLMCDDLASVIKSLEEKRVACTEIQKQRWGESTTVQLPSGSRIGLYQPTHQTPLGLGSMQNHGAL